MAADERTIPQNAVMHEEDSLARELLTRSRRRVRTGVRAVVRTFRLHGLRHWLNRERDAFTQTAKAALACLISWLVAQHIFNVSRPILAPIASLITMQVTVYQTLTRGLQQVAGVIAGVSGAVLIGKFYGLNWATLTIVVLASLVIGRTLRLGPQVNQVASSGLLALGFGDIYGVARIYDTMIGAAIGAAVNAFIAPPTFTRTAAKEVGDLADDLGDLAKKVAHGIKGDWTHRDAQAWLGESRELGDAAGQAVAIADRAEESVRFHVRRSAHLDDVKRVDEAATALNHVADQLNALIRGMSDLARLSDADRLPQTAVRLPDELSLLIEDTGKALNFYGRLQLPDRSSPRILEELRVLLTDARVHRRSASKAMLPDEDTPTLQWSMYGALLDDARRMLYELDPDTGPHRAGVPEEVRIIDQ